MIQRDGHGHDEADWVENVDCPDGQEGVLTDPDNELVEVQLHKLEVEDAQADH